jgi:hypothetical protein
MDPPERWTLKQARQAVARRILIIRLWGGRSTYPANWPRKGPFDVTACNEFDRLLPGLNGSWTDAVANG